MNSATTLTNVLKVTWTEETLQDLTYRMQALLPYLKKIRRTIVGKDYSFPVKTYPFSSSRFATENPTMVAATDEQLIRGYFNPKNVYSTRAITQAAMDDAANGGSIVDAAVYIPKEVARMHAYHVARGCWTGDYGALAVCGTTSDSTTLQLATNSNMRRFFRNMIIDVRQSTTGADAAGSTGGNSATISAVDEDNFTLTTANQITTTSANSVYIEDEAYASAGAIGSYCWNGLPALVGTSTIHTVNTTTYPEFKSYVNTATGSLTLGKMQKPCDWIEGRYQGKVKTMLTSPEVVIKYGDLMVGDMRYKQSDLDNMEAGYATNLWFRGGTMGRIPIIKDGLCPLDEMFYIDWDAFQLRTSAWLKWLDADGSILHYITRTLGYEIAEYSRGNLCTVNRLGSGKLQAITI